MFKSFFGAVISCYTYKNVLSQSKVCMVMKGELDFPLVVDE